MYSIITAFMEKAGSKARLMERDSSGRSFFFSSERQRGKKQEGGGRFTSLGFSAVFLPNFVVVSYLMKHALVHQANLLVVSD